MPLCSALASLPAASAEHEDDQQNASRAQSHAEDQERRPSLFDAASEHVEVLSPEASKEGDGQENRGHIREPAAHERHALGQLMVIDLVQHPLLEYIQPFVKLQGK